MAFDSVLETDALSDDSDGSVDELAFRASLFDEPEPPKRTEPRSTGHVNPPSYAVYQLATWALSEPRISKRKLEELLLLFKDGDFVDSVGTLPLSQDALFTYHDSLTPDTMGMRHDLTFVFFVSPIASLHSLHSLHSLQSSCPEYITTTMKMPERRKKGAHKDKMTEENKDIEAHIASSVMTKTVRVGYISIVTILKRIMADPILRCDVVVVVVVFVVVGMGVGVGVGVGD